MATKMTDAEYKERWKDTGPLRVKMIEKLGKCSHELGDTFYYDSPYKKPTGMCEAIQYVIDLYVWRAALGFPSWEPDDRDVYKLHCPSKKGTVWELRRVAEKE